MLDPDPENQINADPDLKHWLEQFCVPLTETNLFLHIYVVLLLLHCVFTTIFGKRATLQNALIALPWCMIPMRREGLRTFWLEIDVK